jgi:hypothetical protein
MTVQSEYTLMSALYTALLADGNAKVTVSGGGVTTSTEKWSLEQVAKRMDELRGMGAEDAADVEGAVTAAEMITL